MSEETTSEQLAEIEGQRDTIQVREGRWRTRGGEEKKIRPCEPLKGAYYVWPWTDGFMTFQDNGLHQGSKESDHDLVEYLGPIEPDKTQELPDKTQELETKTQELPEYTPPEGWRVVRFGEQLLPGDVWVNQDGTERRSAILHWDASAVSGGRCIRRIGPEPQPESQPHAAAIEELRSEVSYVQRLLGESNRKVTQLEELVGSLRNINVTQEKAFTAAGKENTALRNQLLAAKAELVQERLERNRWHNQALRVTAELDDKTTQCEILQIELDAAQQVPADSLELRQLRADLEQVTRERDEYRYAHDVLVKDANTVHERTKAMIVEAIAEWLEPVRLIDNPNLANETLQHLPQIMRHLTGLNDEEIE